MSLLHGCIPIVCTPFHEDGSVDFASLDREVDWLIGEGAGGLSVLAISGEGWKLTDAERDEVASAVIRRSAGRVPVMVSADGAGTEVAVDRAQRAVKLGADALMVLPPYFIKPDQNGLFDYYSRIGRAVDVPIMIQDAPQVTGVSMGPALWSRLANEVSTIQYVKAEGMPQGNTLSETLRQSNGKLEVFCGWAGIGMMDAMERGASGSMPAPNFTRLFTDVQKLWEAGDQTGAADLFHAEFPFVVWTSQSPEHSVFAAKEEMRSLGVLATSTLRQPCGTLDAVTIAQLQHWLKLRHG